jgi:hypothetical protein
LDFDEEISMAEEQPSLHIDTDWKKQAQEEKRRLAEEEEKKKAQQPKTGPAPTSPMPGVGAGAAAGPSTASSRGRERGTLPAASFGSLVQSLTTQVLFYLGELTPRGVEPQVNLDMAKYNIDLLGVLEDKTKNNLDDEERRLLDAALYETRMRYVSVASQYATV